MKLFNNYNKFSSKNKIKNKKIMSNFKIKINNKQINKKTWNKKQKFWMHNFNKMKIIKILKIKDI